MKKSLRKLIPAILMVLISASLMGTSTFAWFSLNSKVTVTGMVVRTTLADNLLIAPVDTASGKNDGNREANYLTDLLQTRNAIIEPASTVNGVNYWYANTAYVDAAGDAKDDTHYREYSEATALANTTAAKTNYDATFQTNYGITDTITTSNVVYAYVDYSFYLKATNTGETADLVLDTCNLLYKGATPTAETAWRVAVFAAAAAKDDENDSSGSDVVLDSDAAVAGNLKGILSLSGATYFTSGKALTANAAPSTDVSSLNPTGGVKIAASMAAGATGYYKVVVRLWLEGEDTTCNNDTFAVLTSNWTLDLGFSIGGTAVTKLNDTGSLSRYAALVKATATGETATATIADELLAGRTATYKWYNNDGTEASGTNNAASYTATTDGTYYCLITVGTGTYAAVYKVSVEIDVP